jgi:hypothetical protein
MSDAELTIKGIAWLTDKSFFVGWVEVMKPSKIELCWVSLSLYPTYRKSMSDS